MATTTPDPAKALADAEAARIAAAVAAPAVEAVEPDTISVRFHRPLGIGGKDYPAGVHDVPMAHIEADRWFFEAHAAEGNVSPVEEFAADGTPAKLPRKGGKVKA